MRGAPALYLITDRRACARPLPDEIGRTLEGLDGAHVAVQLREKDLTARELFRVGGEVLSVCRRYGVPLLINDRVDVAMALGAHGVHLGGGSLPACEVRRIWPEAFIGVSCHSAAQVHERAPGADFATWGPVFATPSKASYGPPVGTTGLDDALSVGLPLVALGGIDEANATGVRPGGFAGIACIRAVFSSPEPHRAARRLLAAFQAADRE
ncbi:MAG: thiamine phosphate synthase [Deltaproteobacteria bacterium]|nr:thiamine phosphate synthase [Deltaproteobacteria bacterium]